MSQLVVHIGAAKTATTYLQFGLFANASVLEEHGVYLPKAGRLPEFGSRLIAHHNLAWEYTDRVRFRPQSGGWAALRRELAEIDAPTVLLSCEGFERMARRAVHRRALVDNLHELSDDVRIVYVVRDQLSQLNSLYGQAVKQLGTPRSFQERTSKWLEDGRFDLEQCFSALYSDDRFEFVAVPFPKLVDGDPLVNFLATSGVDITADDLSLEYKGSNSSLGPIGIEAATLLSHHLRVLDPGFSTASMASRELYRVASTRARNNGWCEEKYWGWDRADAEHVAATLAESNERFAQAVWGTDWPMPLPVDKPCTAVKLIDQSVDQVAHVERYVHALGRRYVELRTGLRKTRSPSEPDARPADQDSPVLDVAAQNASGGL